MNSSEAVLNCREIGNVTIVDLSGKITLGLGAVVLREGVKKLLGEGKKKIILNLAEVAYIDAAGVGELVSSFTTVSNQGGCLKLLNPTQQVEGMLRIIKLYTVFEVFDDEAKAVASFK